MKLRIDLRTRRRLHIKFWRNIIYYKQLLTYYKRYLIISTLSVILIPSLSYLIYYSIQNKPVIVYDEPYLESRNNAEIQKQVKLSNQVIRYLSKRETIEYVTKKHKVTVDSNRKRNLIKYKKSNITIHKRPDVKVSIKIASKKDEKVIADILQNFGLIYFAPYELENKSKTDSLKNKANTSIEPAIKPTSNTSNETSKEKKIKTDGK